MQFPVLGPPYSIPLSKSQLFSVCIKSVHVQQFALRVQSTIHYTGLMGGVSDSLGSEVQLLKEVVT